MMARRPSYPSGGRGLPRVPYGNPAAGARMLADMIPAAIAEAEALGADLVAGHLRMALLVAERREADGRSNGPPEPGSTPF